jgi:hypothetical protein
MLLGPDSRLDHEGVESVRDQGDSKVDLVEGLVESTGIIDVQRNGRGVLETLGELLGTFEGTASCFVVEDPRVRYEVPLDLLERIVVGGTYRL